MKKKFAIVFLSLFLVVSLPFAAHANIVTATGKYLINAVKHVPGAVRVDATNTATGAKHVIKHGISSADLGKGIGAGIVGMAVGSGVGLAFQAITGLALDAVDWVMDPANNQINWKEKGGGAGGSSSGAITPADPYQWGYNSKYYKTADAACRAAFIGAPAGWVYVNASITGASARCNVINPDGTAMINNTVYRFPNPAYDPSASGGSGGSGDDVYKSLPLVDLSKKVLDLADSGNPAAQKAVEDYVTNLAKEGKLDTELDNSTDITKPDDPETTCPSGTVKIGDTCIKLPDPDSPDASGCGPCCSELLAILIATAKLNADFYAKSLDNDAKALAALNQINAQITKLNADFNLLLNEAKLTNKTLTEINEGQDLHFTELKQKVDDLKLAVETGNADILSKLSAVDASIQQTNQKLDKLNENLEKMQKCEGTEFNKKLCDFVDWVKQEPDASEENGTVDVTDKSEGLNIDHNRIDFSNQCPAPTPINTSVGGFPVSTEFNYQPLCDFFTMLNPFVVGMGGISSALIIAGGARRG